MKRKSKVRIFQFAMTAPVFAIVIVLSLSMKLVELTAGALSDWTAMLWSNYCVWRLKHL